MHGREVDVGILFCPPSCHYHLLALLIQVRTLTSVTPHYTVDTSENINQHYTALHLTASKKVSVMLRDTADVNSHTLFCAYANVPSKVRTFSNWRSFGSNFITNIPPDETVIWGGREGEGRKERKGGGEGRRGRGREERSKGRGGRKGGGSVWGKRALKKMQQSNILHRSHF